MQTQMQTQIQTCGSDWETCQPWEYDTNTDINIYTNIDTNTDTNTHSNANTNTDTTGNTKTAGSSAMWQ